ncbi:MAG: ATP-binding protein [Candidatus Eiseniibacteriota bacterium]
MARSKSTPTPHVAEKHVFVAPAGASSRAAGLLAEGNPAGRLDEASLRLREQLFRHIISGLGIGVVLLDAQSRILVCNAASYELLGLTEEQFLKRTGVDSSWDTVYEDGTVCPPHELPAARVMRSRSPVRGQLLGMLRPDSPDRIWLLIDVVPYLDARGEVVELIASFRDVTEQRNAQEALRASEEQLRHSQKIEAVGRLAGGVAHDFNNLLTVILGYADLMISRMADDDPLRHEADEIRRSAQRAGSLTRQLLAFSRKHVHAPRVVDLASLIDELHPMLRRLIGEDIVLTVKADPAEAIVRADTALLEQVVVNLAINARDAMPDGGRMTIELGRIELAGAEAAVWGVAPGTYARLAVTDFGHGMDEATLARVFEPFFTTKERERGTGLGLSTVFGIVQQSGGGIRASSRPGEGSTFEFVLPTVAAEAESDRPNPTSGELGGGETILLVEDEASVRHLAQRMLTSAGYHVLVAADAESALRISSAHAGDIDLLVTDVVMPGMNGRALRDLVLQSRRDIATLFISGYPDDRLLIADPAVSLPFLQKPFETELFLSRVRELLSQRAPRPA